MFSSSPRAALRLATLAVFAMSAPLRAEQITVFAAASLKEAMEETAALWHENSGHDVAFSFAGSSLLARQIELGAPVDVFISANSAWMEYLEQNGVVRAGTIHTLARNQLVLIAHDPSANPVDLITTADLRPLLDGGRLALALVDAVPAGIYAQQALGHFNLWDTTAPHIAQTDNVRAALALVSLGEAPLGITYASDARSDPNVSIIARFPVGSHDPITYPAALIADSAHQSAATAFLDFLLTPAVHQILRQKGFLIEEQ